MLLHTIFIETCEAVGLSQFLLSFKLFVTDRNKWKSEWTMSGEYGWLVGAGCLPFQILQAPFCNIRSCVVVGVKWHLSIFQHRPFFLNTSFFKWRKKLERPILKLLAISLVETFGLFPTMANWAFSSTSEVKITLTKFAKESFDRTKRWSDNSKKPSETHHVIVPLFILHL